MKRSEEVELSFPSDFKYLGAVDAVVQDLAREFSFPDKCVNDISTALIEACTNAIEHGNKFSPDKRVRVVIRFENEAMTARVYDQGKGFDFESELKRAAPPDPLSEKGRGLLIMKALADSLRFTLENEAGFCAELKKTKRESG